MWQKVVVLMVLEVLKSRSIVYILLECFTVYIRKALFLFFETVSRDVYAR